MSMLLFVESMLWSIIGEAGFVVSSVVPSAQALLSFHMPTGKLGLRPPMIRFYEKSGGRRGDGVKKDVICGRNIEEHRYV
jgi:hypothetical protein